MTEHRSKNEVTKRRNECERAKELDTQATTGVQTKKNNETVRKTSYQAKKRLADVEMSNRVGRKEEI